MPLRALPNWQRVSRNRMTPNAPGSATAGQRRMTRERIAELDAHFSHSITPSLLACRECLQEIKSLQGINEQLNHECAFMSGQIIGLKTEVKCLKAQLEECRKQRNEVIQALAHYKNNPPPNPTLPLPVDSEQGNQ